MAKQGSVKGASMISHGLKEFGYGKSMRDGLDRLARESREAGRQEAINYLKNLNIFERILGRKIG